MPLRQSGGMQISTIQRMIDTNNREIEDLRGQLATTQEQSSEARNLKSQLETAIQKQSRANRALDKAMRAMHSDPPPDAQTVSQNVRDMLSPVTPGGYSQLPQTPSQVTDRPPPGPRWDTPPPPPGSPFAPPLGGDDDTSGQPVAGSFAGVTIDPDTTALAPATSGTPGNAPIQEDYGSDVPHPEMSQLAEEVKSRAIQMETAIKEGNEATKAVGGIIGLEARHTRNIIDDVTGAVGRLQRSGREISKQKQDRKYLSSDTDVATKQLETIGSLSQQNPRAAKVYERGLITLQQMQDKTYVEALEKSLQVQEERQGDITGNKARKSQPAKFSRVIKQSDGIGRYHRPRFDTSPYYAR